MFSFLRIFAKLLCLIAMIFLVGCAPSTQSATPPLQTQTVDIWVWDETFNVKAAKMAAQWYQADHPYISVRVETREREQILADVKSLLSAKLYDRLPEIIMIEDYDTQEMLGKYPGEFVDLTDSINAEAFFDYKTSLCSRNGRLYGIPFDSGVTALFYRLDILQQAGYGEADMQNLTWDRFMEIGKDVYEKTGTPMLTLDPTDLPLMRMNMQSCGTWFCDSEGRITVEDNIALMHSLSLYEQLLKNNVAQSAIGWNEFISAFQNGNVACVISGGWIISSIKAVEEQSGLWRMAPIPVFDDLPESTACSNIGGSSWYILKNTPSATEATRFMVSSFSPDNTDLWSKLVDEIGVIPYIRDTDQLPGLAQGDPFFGGQPVTQTLASLALDIPTVNYGSNTYGIESILQQEFQNALISNNLQHCLQSVQQKAEAISAK